MSRRRRSIYDWTDTLLGIFGALALFTVLGVMATLALAVGR